MDQDLFVEALQPGCRHDAELLSEEFTIVLGGIIVSASKLRRGANNDPVAPTLASTLSDEPEDTISSKRT
ncbi:MAG: hypothetical protein ABJA81_02480 [Nocardioidaceae bacterium]